MKSNVKKELKLLLREYKIPQDELYFRTGFYFSDVNDYIVLNEIKRLLGEN